MTTPVGSNFLQAVAFDFRNKLEKGKQKLKLTESKSERVTGSIEVWMTSSISQKFSISLETKF
jgi:hypothetical protein